MAPNKKTIANVIDTFAKADVGRMVKSEFRPLTAPTKTDSAFPSAKKTDLSLHDYWTWEADTAAEEVAEALSAQHIEENLIRQATELTEEEKVCYWDEAVDAKPASRSSISQDDDYWTWSPDTEEDILTTDHVQENLIKAGAASRSGKVVRSGVNSDSYWDATTAKDREVHTELAGAIVNRPQPLDSYWSWPASKAQQNDLANIKRDEAVRQLLSANHIVSNIVKEASDLYWQSEQEQRGIEDDAYWSWAEPRAVVSAPKGYWDW